MQKVQNKTTYRILFLLLMVLLFNSCKIGRFFFYNFADIQDHKIFAARPLKNDSTQFSFLSATTPKCPKTITTDKNKEISFDTYLESNKTVAFLIIKNDTIQYENYFKGYDKTSIVPSFSMAKSITSILIGCAIDDGLIDSVNEPILKYIPELNNNNCDKITIRHLLQMTSGLKCNENYINPFGDAANIYYGTNLRKAMFKIKGGKTPGTEFNYVSVGSQMLGLVLERALKTKTVTQYLQEKLWQPLGMEYEASWSIDKKKNGMEKTFCCINARTRDFAKIGRLYLKKGNWNGKQLVSENWVKESTKVDTKEGSVWFYQYQWWLPSKTGDFMAEGILGQFIYVNPNKNLIVVRLGKKEGDVDWWKFFTNLSKQY